MEHCQSVAHVRVAIDAVLCWGWNTPMHLSSHLAEPWFAVSLAARRAAVYATSLLLDRYQIVLNHAIDEDFSL